MPKGVKVLSCTKDDICREVALYQSEHKCTLKESVKVISEKYGFNMNTVRKWFQERKGKNPVILEVAKKKDKTSVKLAATSISSSAQLDAEKIIFDYLKGLNTFKRILACICGFDKFCMHYGCKKMDKR